MLRRFHLSHIICFGLSLLIIGVYFFAWFKLSLNIPIGDDFPAYVELTSKFSANQLKVSDFFLQINEHRILYDRLWWIINLGLTNFVNFKFLLFIGNLSLVFLLMFFYKIIADLKLSIWLLPAAALVIFSWVGYSNSLCSMMALQNYTFPLLVCWGIYFLANGSSNNQYFLGNIALLLAFYTSGIGFIAMAFGVTILFFRKLYKPALISLLVSAVFIGIYFKFYQSSPVQSDILAGISNPVELSIRYFAFLGGILNISHLSPIPEVILGLMLFGAFLFSLQKLKNKLPLDLLVITLFFLFLAGIVVTARFELNEYIANRFKINSAIIFICIAILFWQALAENKIRKFFIAGLLFITAALNLFNYKAFNDYKYWVDEFAVDLLNVKYGVETTAYQPKGKEYIRKAFYNPNFQKAFNGLNEQEILKYSIPVEVLSSPDGGLELRIKPLQRSKVNRPVLCCKNQYDQIIGYFPLHGSKLNGEAWKFNDVSGIIASKKNYTYLVADLKP